MALLVSHSPAEAESMSFHTAGCAWAATTTHFAFLTDLVNQCSTHALPAILKSIFVLSERNFGACPSHMFSPTTTSLRFWNPLERNEDAGWIADNGL